MSDFELANDTLVSGLAIARLHGVTDQTVANWRKKGMPTAGKNGRGPLYDPAQCDHWIRSNVGTRIRGGRRPGAGRKARAPDPDPVFQNGVEAADARRRARARHDLVHTDELLNLTHRELVAIVSLEPEESGLTKNALERLKLIQETRARHREELQKLGTLVDAEEAASVYARKIGALRERIEQLAHRLLRPVMSAGGVAAGLEPVVLAALEAEVRGVVNEIRGELG